MTNTTTAPVNEALDRIGALATQIPSSSSFASASIAQEILEYAHRIQGVRAAATPPQTQIIDLLEALKASIAKSSSSTGETASPTRQASTKR